MNVLYYILFGIWYLLSLLPLRVHYVISDGLYLIVGKLMKYRHKVIWKT